MTLDLRGKTIEITQAGDSKNIGVKEVGKLISVGGAQVVYDLSEDNSRKVLKILYGPRWNGARIGLIANGIDIQSFHLGVLRAVESAGVKFPEYWDVISGTLLTGEVFNGFIQSYIQYAEFGSGGLLPNVGQRDGKFNIQIRRGYENSPHDRDDDSQEFSGGVYLDWDTYLKWILTGKKEDETLEEFYERIANTKMD